MNMRRLLIFIAKIFNIDLIEVEHIVEHKYVALEGTIYGDVTVKGNLIVEGNLTANGEVSSIR